MAQRHVTEWTRNDFFITLIFHNFLHFCTAFASDKQLYFNLQKREAKNNILRAMYSIQKQALYFAFLSCNAPKTNEGAISVYNTK